MAEKSGRKSPERRNTIENGKTIFFVCKPRRYAVNTTYYPVKGLNDNKTGKKHIKIEQKYPKQMQLDRKTPFLTGLKTG